ncbi:hypothetical protein QPK32_02025 [Massilia sp. YIM B02763]|uniref:hypothetical protein n=1 Tax=Massilia sp. YIM B02763 TaxID=3050130 RepID=UPI0025B6DA40|nr:hypothetical protein [Massilia sp. YIM B02763]MDN4051863.1 hypothetical protein [Massilia sp. YIM B02763]
MKKLFWMISLGMFLVGCAASTFNGARSKANLVTNGMSVEQAIEVIGSPPTYQTERSLEWRRGTAQEYDATPAGAIRFRLQAGLVTDVPPGGIFSPEARRRFVAEWAAERDRRQLVMQQEQDEAARAAKQAALQRAVLAADEAEKNRAQVAAEIAEEGRAAAAARIACNVKTSCAKVFALAQIYIATETDQKIQVVTDSVIQTYNPTEAGHVGASIIKMPQRGDGAEVSLSLSCKVDQYDTGSLCRLKKTNLYKRFRPFIESRLAL